MFIRSPDMLSQAEPKNDMPPMLSPSPKVREDINLKKKVFFQALPESPNPQPLDSIAVSLSTNSETAAATPLGVMRNFQLTINQ